MTQQGHVATRIVLPAQAGHGFVLLVLPDHLNHPLEMRQVAGHRLLQIEQNFQVGHARQDRRLAGQYDAGVRQQWGLVRGQAMGQEVCGQEFPQSIVQCRQALRAGEHPHFCPMRHGFSKQTANIVEFVWGIEMELNLGHDGPGKPLLQATLAAGLRAGGLRLGEVRCSTALALTCWLSK